MIIERSFESLEMSGDWVIHPVQPNCQLMQKSFYYAWRLQYLNKNKIDLSKAPYFRHTQNCQQVISIATII